MALFKVYQPMVTESGVLSPSEIYDSANYPTEFFNDLIERNLATVNYEVAQQGLTKLLRMLQAGLVSKIELIGDSITAGEGATGFVTPSSGTVIFNDGAGNIFYEAGTTPRTWANFFREYITANFPAVQFVNKGIQGKSAKWANVNKTNWVSNNGDVVIVMLGTNDRWDNTSLAQYKTDLTEFLAYVKQRSNFMLVMTANPTLNDFADDAGTTPNASYKFGMKEVDRVITQICNENGYFHVSHYREILRNSMSTKTGLTSLLQGRTVGSHPVDNGYKVMWRTMQQALGMIDNTIQWDGSAQNGSFATRELTFAYDTPAHDSRFTARQWVSYVSIISNSDTNISQYPESTGGILKINFGANDAYTFEEYQVRTTGNVYRRYWNYVNATTGSWGAWSGSGISTKKGIDNNRLATDSITVYPVNSVEHTIVGGTNTTLAQYPEGASGILITHRYSSDIYSFQVYHIRQTNKVYKRYWDNTNNVWTAWVKVSAV